LTTTRNSLFLGVGLAIGLVGSAGASERLRDSSAAGAADRATTPVVSPSDITDLGNGTAIVNAGGQLIKLSADGSIKLDDYLEYYGSVDRGQFEERSANLSKSWDPSVGMVSADGSVGFFGDLLGADMPRPVIGSVEELKSSRPWVERVVDGVTVMALVDGSVVIDSSVAFAEPDWVTHRNNVSNQTNENGFRVYADNMVFLEPAVLPKDGQ